MSQKKLLFFFLFIAANVLLLLLHVRMFNLQPVYGFITAAVHTLLLIVFPYSRFTKTR